MQFNIINKNDGFQKEIRRLFIHLFIICPAKNIIHGDVVEIRKNQQMLHRDSLKAPFITGIDRLTCKKELCNLRLIHILIFAQIPEPLKKHETAPFCRIVVLEPFSTIDFITKLGYNFIIVPKGTKNSVKGKEIARDIFTETQQ